MRQVFRIDHHRAMLLASSVVDMRITQLVNKVRGVHAFLSHERAAGLNP
jgi:acetamidase/formamidase